MAYLERFELPTQCLEGTCSVQLSYRYIILIKKPYIYSYLKSEENAVLRDVEAYTIEVYTMEYYRWNAPPTLFGCPTPCAAAPPVPSTIPFIKSLTVAFIFRFSISFCGVLEPWVLCC